MAVKKLLLEDPPSAQSSSSESESETESESNAIATPSSAGFALNPIAKRKPQDDQPKSKDEEKAKKPRLSPPPPTSAGTTARHWSDDDEIAILTGLSDYRSENNSDPQSDPNAFHAFVTPKLSYESSKSQLAEKIRRLKKKYFDLAADGGPLASAKPHEARRFELSKRVWGLGGAQSQRKVKKGKKEVDRVGFRAEFPRVSESVGLFCGPNVSDSLLRTVEDSVPLIPISKAKVLEKKWKKLEDEELELRLERAEFARDAYQLILDAIKSRQD